MFIRRYIVPTLGVLGIAFAIIYTTKLSNPPRPEPQQLSLPMASPYNESISGSGIVEANTRNIAVGSELSGVVTEIYVQVGQDIKKGDALFKLDDRATAADFAVRQKNISVSDANLARARAELAQAQDQLQRAQNLRPGISVSNEKLQQLALEVKTAVAKVSVAAAELETARAELKSTGVTMDRLIVRAPIDGSVLQVNARIGEYVKAGEAKDPPIVVGNIKPLHVRVSFDENDLWRYKPGSDATGALRGNKDVTFKLKFIRVEPFVVPKRSLTGDTAERVDTRVLDVIYEIADTDAPIYVGQQIDVFVQSADQTSKPQTTNPTPALESPSTSPAP